MKSEIVIVKSEVMDTLVTGAKLNINSHELSLEMKKTMPALRAAAKTFCQIHGSSMRRIEFRLMLEIDSDGNKRVVHAAVYCDNSHNVDNEADTSSKNAIKRTQYAWGKLPKVIRAVDERANQQLGCQNSISVTANSGNKNEKTVEVENEDIEALFNNIRTEAKTKNVIIPNIDQNKLPCIVQKPSAPTVSKKTKIEITGDINAWDSKNKVFKILDGDLKEHSVKYSEKNESDVRLYICQNKNCRFFLNPITQLLAGKTHIRGFILVEILGR